MARIILNGSIAKYPVAGIVQFVLAWILGLNRLGHRVFFIEKCEWENACYDMKNKEMTDDASFGVEYLKGLFKSYDMDDRWCFKDFKGNYFGMSENSLRKIFKNADLYFDLEWTSWEEGSENVPVKAFFDGEPGWFQIKLHRLVEKGDPLIRYDYYFTDGLNIGTPGNIIPTAGIDWKKTLAPVLLLNNRSDYRVPLNDAPFTTVMSWQAHKEVSYLNQVYGQKDKEFSKFLELPSLTHQPLEIGVSGSNIPSKTLEANGWKIKNANEISCSLKDYHNYLAASKGELCIAKNVFVATNSGWFGERAGYYMQKGRPVVSQETGFSQHIPCGEGLFAFENNEQAVAAIESVVSNYDHHSKKAKEIVGDYFDAEKVLEKMLTVIGI